MRRHKLRHYPSCAGAWPSFWRRDFTQKVADRLSTLLCPCISHPTPTSLTFGPLFSPTPANNPCSFLFLPTSTHLETLLTIWDFEETLWPSSNCILLIQLTLLPFSLLWLAKGAPPHLWELFLRPTNIRSTSTSLRQPNLHPFRLLPRPIMPLLAFPIHLGLGFLIMEPLIIFPVIRTFFFPYPNFSSTHGYFS